MNMGAMINTRVDGAAVPPTRAEFKSGLNFGSFKVNKESFAPAGVISQKHMLNRAAAALGPRLHRTLSHPFNTNYKCKQ